jgi:demethylmenaquinone methyltransferase/2-methoxy-6-polyprenyl-1,4-benzoquinol methylase
VARAHLDKQPAAVSAMFDQVAGRYDLLNDVLSLGQDRWWRRAVARAVNARPGERVLDLAAGTGTSTAALTTTGAATVACDFSLGMLTTGMRRLKTAPASREGSRPPAPAFVAGDALRLPFADAAFDAVTISFGLRNTAEPGRALAEMLRVTRPGGRLVVCEFSHLAWPWLDAAYQKYLATMLPLTARWLSSTPSAYQYLAQSIRDWPRPADLARWITAAGWACVRWRPLSLGIVTIHTARHPGTCAAGPPPAPSPEEHPRGEGPSQPRPPGPAHTTDRGSLDSIGRDL